MMGKIRTSVPNSMFEELINVRKGNREIINNLIGFETMIQKWEKEHDPELGSTKISIPMNACNSLLERVRMNGIRLNSLVQVLADVITEYVVPNLKSCESFAIMSNRELNLKLIVAFEDYIFGFRMMLDNLTYALQTILRQVGIQIKQDYPKLFKKAQRKEIVNSRNEVLSPLCDLIERYNSFIQLRDIRNSIKYGFPEINNLFRIEEGNLVFCLKLAIRDITKKFDKWSGYDIDLVANIIQWNEDFRIFISDLIKIVKELISVEIRIDEN